MIEHRILERKVKRPRGIDDGMFNPKLPDFIYVDVPQYRRGSYPYRSPYEDEWVGTDWIDVPRVRETVTE